MAGTTNTSYTANTPWYSYTPVGDFGQTFSWATYPVQGEDIPMPQDTPITALFAGTVTDQYYNAGGGQVIIKASDPTQLKGIPYYYYVHLDQITTQVGETLTPGQLIGYSGGQNVGGQHPSAPNYSSGPHLELGLAKSNAIPYQLSQITPDLNPDWLLGYAQNQKIDASGTITGGRCPVGNEKCTCPPGYNVAKNSLGNPICRNTSFPFDAQSCKECPASSTDPLTNISNFITSLGQLTQWLNDPIRILKLVVGIMLVGGAIFLIASPQGQIAQGLTKTVGGISKTVGKVTK